MLDFFARLCGDLAHSLSANARPIVNKHNPDYDQPSGFVDQNEDGTWRAVGRTADGKRIFTGSGVTMDEAFDDWNAQRMARMGIVDWDDSGNPIYGLPPGWSSDGPTPEDVYGQRGGAFVRQHGWQRYVDREDWREDL